MNYDEIEKKLLEYDTECKERIASSQSFNFVFDVVKERVLQITRSSGLCEHMNEMRVYPYVRYQKERIEYTPLNAFFENYSSYATVDDVHKVETTLDAHGNCCEMFFMLKRSMTPPPENLPFFYSGFFIGGFSGSSFSLKLVDHQYSDGKSRLTLRSTQLNGDPNGFPPIINLSLILFNKCTACGKYQPRIKKCKGCWDNLSLRVPYCDKTCQTNDFYAGGHKSICGARVHGSE